MTFSLWSNPGLPSNGHSLRSLGCPRYARRLTGFQGPPFSSGSTKEPTMTQLDLEMHEAFPPMTDAEIETMFEMLEAEEA